jgi:hypothetical protein
MPTLELTADELRDAAQAARAAAQRAMKDMEAQANPRIVRGFAEASQRYTALAAKFEAAR